MSSSNWIAAISIWRSAAWIAPASVLRLTAAQDPFVMVMRRGHPASRRKLSPAALCGAATS